MGTTFRVFYQKTIQKRFNVHKKGVYNAVFYDIFYDMNIVQVVASFASNTYVEALKEALGHFFLHILLNSSDEVPNRLLQSSKEWRFLLRAQARAPVDLRKIPHIKLFFS